MSADADSQTVTTLYGEVDVETKQCAQCGDEHVVDDMAPVVVGDTIGNYGYDVTVRGTPDVFRLCPFCSESQGVPGLWHGETGSLWIRAAKQSLPSVDLDYQQAAYLIISTLIVLWTGAIVVAEVAQSAAGGAA